MLKQSKPVRKRQMLRAKLQHYRRWHRYAGVWAFFKERGIKISPVKLGRMNGRHLDSIGLFTKIDETDSYWREEYAEVFLRNASTRSGSDTERSASCTSVR